LPEASFAGAAETFLNIRGEDALLRAVHQCFASLFTDRAISYRARQGFGQLKVALSVGVMPMVRSDLASSGVIFTLDTESGFRDVVTVTGSYGIRRVLGPGCSDA
jgi:pyruvate,water dikinase